VCFCARVVTKRFYDAEWGTIGVLRCIGWCYQGGDMCVYRLSRRKKNGKMKFGRCFSFVGSMTLFLFLGLRGAPEESRGRVP
jgi:hypothetical protein